MRTFVISGIIALGLSGIVLGACSAPYSYLPGECDPNADFPSARCLALQADAGTDGDAEPTKEPTGFDDPGLDPAAWHPCGDGFCAPELSGQSALVWDRIPVSLYVGPNDGTSLACPDNLTEVGRYYDELVAPPAACDACTCGASKGECYQPPDKIEIRAGTCAESGVPFSPFDGPLNWTGTCSSDGGLSAGTMCGNEPCAQSVWASPLPPPKGDACLPTTSIPLSTKEFAWTTRGIACESKTEQDACSSEKQYCAANLGPEWLTCVHQKGIHNLSDCPDEYNASVHRLYPYEPVDDRGCTDCSCGAPAGSACIGNMPVYDDAACSNQFVNLLLGSMSENCTGIIPAGRAIGAKRVTDLAYLPGTCGSTGGEPKGLATGNAANAVTFCCMKPSPPKPPQTIPG
jgi:hypothetical protein